MPTPEVHPQDRDSWTIEVDYIPGVDGDAPTFAGSVVNRRTGETHDLSRDFLRHVVVAVRDDVGGTLP